MTPASSLTSAVDRLENAGPLDSLAAPVRSAIQALLRPRALKDALHGTWLGHPLHPMLTDVPIGCWTSTAVLDLLPGTGQAATVLVAAGLAAAVPTAVSGWADWSELTEAQQRVGLVHAAANVAGIALYTASLGARMSGHPLRGKVYAVAGLAAVSAGGYLGGHLAYRQGAGVSRVSTVAEVFPSGWQDAGLLDDITDGELTARTVGGVGVVVLRRGGHVDVLADTCSHLGESLAKGTFAVESGQGCVVCPWHASTFRFSDGAVVHGPATSPQPVFDTQVVDGRLQVRLPGAG